MKFQEKGFKLIHWDDENIGKVTLNDELKMSFICEPFIVQLERLPVRISWYIKIHNHLNEKDILFSSVFDDKYTFKFLDQSNHFEDLLKIAYISFENVKQEWELKTKSTLLEIIPISVDDVTLLNLATYIFQIAKLKGLIQ